MTSAVKLMYLSAVVSVVVNTGLALRNPNYRYLQQFSTFNPAA